MILEKTSDNCPMSFIDKKNLKPVYPDSFVKHFQPIKEQDQELEVIQRMRMLIDRLVYFDFYYISYLLNNPPVKVPQWKQDLKQINKVLDYYNNFLSALDSALKFNGWLNEAELLKKNFSRVYNVLIKQQIEIRDYCEGSIVGVETILKDFKESQIQPT